VVQPSEIKEKGKLEKWSFCGRAGTLAALVLGAFVAANVASADPGLDVTGSVTAAAAPVTQALPTTAAPVPSTPVATPTAPMASVPAVPKVALPHVVVGAKARASVSVSKRHHVRIKSTATAHARIGKTRAGSRIIAANSSGPCAGYPIPPYNCSQLTFDGDFVNTCDTAVVHLTGYYHEIENAQFDPTTGSVIIYHHLNFQKMRGVGTDLNQYTSSDVDKDYTETVPVLPGLAMHIHTEHQEEQELISLGSDPNQLFHLHTVTDIDIDPLGGMSLPTVSFSGFGLKCTG